MNSKRLKSLKTGKRLENGSQDKDHLEEKAS